MTNKAEIEQLREDFPRGSTVHTVIRHVTSSGMGRTISVLFAVPNGEIYDMSYAAARALGWSMDHRRGGVKVQGAGMDMAFHLVYSLAQALYGDGYALNQRHV